jgi:mediator of RNA polymerase II transcription subunit 7
MAAANDLRPVQARGNLESMMKRQLELRREETRNLHQKCDTLGARISELRATIQESLQNTEPGKKANSVGASAGATPLSIISQVDVFNWAEQV